MSRLWNTEPHIDLDGYCSLLQQARVGSLGWWCLFSIGCVITGSLQVVIECWVEFPVLCNRSLLVVYQVPTTKIWKTPTGAEQTGEKIIWKRMNICICVADHFAVHLKLTQLCPNKMYEKLAPAITKKEGSIWELSTWLYVGRCKGWWEVSPSSHSLVQLCSQNSQVEASSKKKLFIWLHAGSSEVIQSCSTLRGPVDCSLPGSSIHGIFQARILQWVAISFSRRSSQPRDWIQVSRIVGRRFTVWATRGV